MRPGGYSGGGMMCSSASGRIEELVGSVPKSVEMRAAGVNAGVAAELKTRVSRFREEEGGHCTFVVPDLDSANRAAKTIQDAGGTLVYMHPVIESLEDFFTRIQEGAGVALPEEDGLAVLTSKAEE